MKIRIRTRRLLLALASALVASSLATHLSFSQPSLMRRLDYLVYDNIVRRNADPGAASSRIVLVDVDDASFDWVFREFNQDWPWPREFHGVMAKALRDWGASAVGFDFIFGDAYGDDAIAFRDALGEAGAVVLAAASDGIEDQAELPEAGVGLLLGRFSSEEESLERAAFAAAASSVPFLVQEESGWALFVGGYRDAASAARELAQRRALLNRHRPDLVSIVMPGASGREIVAAIEDALIPEIKPLPAGARVIDPRDHVASRFSLGLAAEVSPNAPNYAAALVPQGLVLPSVSALGFVDSIPDEDGVIRRGTLIHSWNGNAYPSLPLALVLVASEESDGVRPRIRHDGSVLHVGDLRIPVDEDGTSLIRFHGAKSYQRVPAWRVLRDAARMYFEGGDLDLDTSVFEGAIVLVAPRAAALMDFKPSPLSSAHLGPDIVAAMVDNLLHEQFLRTTKPWFGALWAVVLSFASVFSSLWIATRATSSRVGGIAAALLLASRALLSLAGLMVGIAAAYYFAVFLHAGAGVWIGAAIPMLSASLAVALFVAGGEFLERRDRRQIHDALGTYTSRAVADLIASEGVEALAPRRAEVSVYFSDIAGFTSFSEKMPPEALAELLNIYLTEMTEVILARDGIVDKYIGDAIMAFWGAPAEQPDHAFSAVACGLKMQARLAEIAPELELKYGVRLVVRAGVNSGQVAVGNMGSAHKVNYTLMGDTVNLGARLEGANKSYDTFLMVGEETWGRLGGRITGRELDLLQVKGKDLPVRVYEPLTLADEVPAERLTWLRKWEEALDAYRQRRFDEAKGLFQEIRRLRGEDGPSKVYLSRCEHFLEHPPPEGWDGAFVMTSK